MKDTKIQWATNTFNPWRGCTQVSAGCANCYADTLSHRNPKVLGVWGPNGTRVVASESMWQEPLKWNAAAAWWCPSCAAHCFEREGQCTACGTACRRPQGPNERPRVFCASLADVFEDWQGPMLNAAGQQLFMEYSGAWCVSRIQPHEFQSHAPGVPDFRAVTMQDVRTRLFDLICFTPHLDWLLLTKRPENVPAMMRESRLYANVDAGNPYVKPNIWLGTSVEDQKAADERIPHMLKIPAAVRFLSCEPILGPVNLTKWLLPPDEGQDFFDALGVVCGNITGQELPKVKYQNDIHWIIAGGESGSGARPIHPQWLESLLTQCVNAKVPFFMKQWGDWLPMSEANPERCTGKTTGWVWPDGQHPDVEAAKQLTREGKLPLPMTTWHVGKKLAGRSLDGQEYSEYPHPQ